MPVVKKLEGHKDLKLRNIDKGYFLKQELHAINELLEGQFADFKKDYYY